MFDLSRGGSSKTNNYQKLDGVSTNILTEKEPRRQLCRLSTTETCFFC